MLIPDPIFLKVKFKIEMQQNLDLKHPTSFNQKLQWLKLNDRNAEYTKMVDKYEVKLIVKEKIGQEYVVENYGLWDSFDEIDFSHLPNQFVLKCTHDSGGVVICSDKSNFNYEKAKIKIENSLNSNFYHVSREWPYKNVQSRIIAEKFLDNNPMDYKFFCFNGEPRLVLVCSDRYSSNGLKEDFYDTDWNKLTLARTNHPNSEVILDRPSSLDIMLNLSKVLSDNIPFVRVDFYDIKGKVYFGELTLYPASGMEGFIPEYWDQKLGNWIKI